MTRNDTHLLAAMRDAARHLEPLSHLAAVRARDTLLRAISAHDAADGCRARRRPARRRRARGGPVMRFADIRRRVIAALRSIADRTHPSPSPTDGSPVRASDLRAGDLFRSAMHRPGEWSRVERIDAWTETKRHGGRTWVNVTTDRGSLATTADRIVYRRTP